MKKNSSKWIAMALCAAMACLILVGCMNTGERVTPDADPSAMPGMTAEPGTNAANPVIPEVNASDMSKAFDWLQMGSSVEDKINMLSEIQTSRVIVNGNTALVGVTFTNQYKGEMTQRIHDMVAGEIQSADSNIQSVAVTAEQEDVDKINQLADRIAAGTPVSELEGDIDAIVRNVTTIQ